MKLGEIHELVTPLFDLDKPMVPLNRDMVCYSVGFSSALFPVHHHVNWPLTAEEAEILNETGETENQNFNYPVITPVNNERDEAIILLHGLNERFWTKYLSWAYFLASNTGKAVIMFPLAFHMNRSPRSWSSTRTMSYLAEARKRKIHNLADSSFANVALSLRMEHTPEMFQISGIQSYFDVINLALSIKAGAHPLFRPNTGISFFAYSIGALLAEVLLIANPASLFSGERAFLFCGGATFDQINGSSKAIMDSQACEKLKEYITSLNQVDTRVQIPQHLVPLLPEAWRVFKSMVHHGFDRDFRDNAFRQMNGRIKAVGLVKDRVVPASAIANTLPREQVITEDFQFNYSHEMPFPLQKNSAPDLANDAFQKVFNLACEHLQ